MIFLETFSLVETNQAKYLEVLEFAREKHNNIFGHYETTKNYGNYNLFAITATDPLMYALFMELRVKVKSALGTRPLWIQAWLNAHSQHEVLQMHNHSWPYHGYISIDPKKTNTVFEDITIENKVGQVYFGKGGNKHRVDVVDCYEGKRITIGFDINDRPGERSRYVSFIPF